MLAIFLSVIYELSGLALTVIIKNQHCSLNVRDVDFLGRTHRPFIQKNGFIILKTSARTLECRLALFKESTLSMFLSAITEFLVPPK